MAGFKLTLLLVLAVLPMSFGGWTRCANGEESLYSIYSVWRKTMDAVCSVCMNIFILLFLVCARRDTRITHTEFASNAICLLL